ncbi:hypothetical protein SDC9_129160 [bioreactor metagenome]|uniref:Uncharacterized protein n=1 Tax=bioreactor metagenome TaxID=1076179 RepID=A0A645CZW6_9ZZZZ
MIVKEIIKDEFLHYFMPFFIRMVALAHKCIQIFTVFLLLFESGITIYQSRPVFYREIPYLITVLLQRRIIIQHIFR